MSRQSYKPDKGNLSRAENREKPRMARTYPQLKQFKPKTPQKYVGDINDIVMRSSWETKFANYCDSNPSILKWNSEGVKVPYWSSADNKERTYHVDFLITMRNNQGKIETLMIEIKPYKQTIKPVKTKGKREETFLNECYTYQVNMDKWQYANKYAKERGWRFVVMTEEQLYNAKVK